MNSLLTRLSDWFNFVSNRTEDSAILIDWKEIDALRRRLVQMRFAKAESVSPAFAGSAISALDASGIKVTSGAQPPIPIVNFSSDIVQPKEEVRAEVEKETAKSGSLRSSFVGASVRQRDRQAIRTWFGTAENTTVDDQATFGSGWRDFGSTADGASAVKKKNTTASQYDAYYNGEENTQAAQTTEKTPVEMNPVVRLAAQRAVMRNKLITTNQNMPAYDLDLNAE